MTSAPRPQKRSERGVYALIAVIALIVIYLIAFVLKNTTHVKVSFVVASTTASLIWVLLTCILLGIVLGLAASRLGHVRPSRRSAAKASGPLKTASTSGPLSGGTPGAVRERTVVRPSSAAGSSPADDAPGSRGSHASPADEGPTTKL
jgi:uncharacterized integral membrane protein